jgi:hypothetical protein
MNEVVTEKEERSGGEERKEKENGKMKSET